MWLNVSGMDRYTNGARGSKLDEPLTVTRFYQVKWSAPRVNLRELALLRFIHAKTERELAKHFGRSKTAIHGLLERMVKNDFRDANLTKVERGENQMNIDKLISISATVAILAVSTGQLPKVLKVVRVAQLQLIKESQASKWGMPMLPPSR